MSADSAPAFDGEWNPSRALENLTMERALSSTETPQQMAKKLLEENLPVAVLAIAHLATYSETEIIRLNAAKFVVERTMGPAERVINDSGKHAWDDIYENVVVEAQNYLQR
jgi:hypothetical protein